ncbi:male sterility protein [Diplodia corticola]|uniref:Male sterility protein n=1 Tax=Diplodia corticola TaxID=236234 RepID=A0A1J9QP26_9PEZI|nr:male sterility protein [Diplodia corticola]OJD30201.1 male sterility protein [Diplodia corticola]
MLVSTTSAPSGLDAPNASKVLKPDQINSINDLLLHKAETIPNTPLIAYPSSEHSSSDLAEYTAKDLDAFVDEAAKEYTRLGLLPKERRSTRSEVVALLGPSNLDYVITLLALSRMGFAVLFLSTRLPTEAYVSLLQKTKCTKIVASARFASTTVADIQRASGENHAIESFPQLDKAVYAPGGRPPTTAGTARFVRRTELVDEEKCVAFIVHSSGSTGLPKPIFQTHRACLSNYALGSGMRAFVTLPLFHNHGLATTFRGIVSGKRTVLFNASLPLTNANLVEAMGAADAESFHCVPYALKVLAETDEGVEQLRRCRLVLFGGSSCPDELGDELVRRGVYVVGHYGATEMGQLMTSFRDPESDKAWNYVRPLPKVAPYLRFVDVGPGIFECVVLDGLPSKVISNSDDPWPNCFRTRDTFVPHPSIPDAWKYLGRLDDRVTLMNGEKVLPIPYEHQVRQHELVQDALVFGIGRAFPGLLVIPSEKAAGMPKEQLLDTLEPTLKTANARAEKFGQVAREMVEILPYGTDYPRTDKGTMIRAACYKVFADLIDAVYTRFESGEGVTKRKLDAASLQSYLADLFANRVGLAATLAPDTDFFAAGMDSLQSISARGHMQRELDLAGAVLGQNVVFEHPSIAQLTAHLDALANGTTHHQQKPSETDLMRSLVAQYTATLPAFVPGTTPPPPTDTVLLTGATGSLGAHILAQLLPLPHITTIYCLVRAPTPTAAHSRILSSLRTRHLSPPPPLLTTKLIALPSDLSLPTLGLPPSTLSRLRASCTTIIHSAWAVNFNLGVSSFAAHHIAGTAHLLRLALSAPFAHPARFAFVSSVSAGAGTPPPAVVREALVERPEDAQGMGYARSKWVAEHVVGGARERAGSAGFRVLRTGQIVGDSVEGVWNETEAIPLMVRAARGVGALPMLDETPAWLPVDRCAEAVVELSGAGRSFGEWVAEGEEARAGDEGLAYHVQNSKTFRWTEDLLPALREAGLEFEVVGQREWVRRLREGEQDPMKNPTVKLVDFFAEKYDNDRPGRKGLVFATEKTAERSKVIREGVDVIGTGVVAKCVQQWLKTW